MANMQITVLKKEPTIEASDLLSSLLTGRKTSSKSTKLTKDNLANIR
jgi:hypothetical protein